MVSYKRLIVLFTICVFAINGIAQTVEWSLLPDNYTDIQCIGKLTYKAVDKDGTVTVLANLPSGRIMPKATCDEITPFYKKWALMLKQEGNKRLVIGCLADDGTCNVFEKQYYALSGQEFYSEDLLTVENAKEKVYIDYQGNEIIGTGKNYSRIKPFSEGLAVVFVNNDEKSFFITKEGQPYRLRSSLLNNVTLVQVTNFHQGKALMRGDNNDYFICDKNGNGEKLSKKPKNMADFLDYLYRFIGSGEDVLKLPPYDQKYKGEVNTVVKPKAEGKGKNVRYGYYMTTDEKIILPCQFALAEPFIDGYAIVKTADGKCGILRYLSESASDFSITPIKKTIEYDKPMDKVICQFKCTPAAWHEHQLQAEVVNLKDIVVTSQGNGLFSFDYFPSGQHSVQTFNINLLSEGIILSSHAITIEFKKKAPPKCSTCGAELSKCPHQGQHGKCGTCNKIIDRGHRVDKKKRCPYDGGKHPEKPKPSCPDCGLPIDKCKYHGNHGII